MRVPLRDSFFPIFLTVLPRSFLQVNFRAIVRFGNPPFKILVGIVLNVSVYLEENADSPSILRLLSRLESSCPVRKLASQLAAGPGLAKPASTWLSEGSY